MTALFLGHVVLFSAFPLAFSMLQPLSRRVHFYLYLAVILLIGGFLGNAYALNLGEGLTVSGGNLCYGAFMMTSVLFVLLERDILVLRHVIRLVVVVDLFNILFSVLVTTTLNAPGVSNPHGTPAALFRQSVPLIVLGGLLIVAELFVLFFWFERVKRWRVPAPFVELAYLLGFVAVLCADGIAFPLIAFGMSPEIVAVVIGGLGGKVLTAAAYAGALLIFMTLWRRRFVQYLEADVFTWRVFLSTSSDLIRTLSENERAQRQAEAVFRSANDGLAVLGADGRVLRANGAFRRLTGAQEAAPAPLFHHAGHVLGLPPRPDESWRGEVRFGAERAAQGILSVTPVPVLGADERTFVCSLTDISEQKRAQEELDHLAMHDPLTDLANRRALDAALRGLAEPVALAILDLDRFKDVNDSFGHVVGDDLLCQVAQRIRSALPEIARAEFFRIGGDEFALLLPGTGEPGLRAAVSALNAVLVPPFTLVNGAAVAMTATWGGSLGRSGRDGDLFARADAALYDVKQGAKGTLGIYQERLTRAAQRRLSLGLRLREALERQMPEDAPPRDGALSVAYQPQIGRDGRLYGLEALARWTDPELGQISPAEFIPLAEDHGLIDRLGRFMLRRACRDGAGWLAAGLDPGRISVNVSALQMRTPGLERRVARVLKETGFPPRALQLELTETVFLGRESEVLPIFEKLKALGVRLAVDDFGTGYSSLSFLPQLPWDTLKIDRSFVALAVGDPRRRALVTSITAMAKGLDLTVIAEGVEAPEQHVMLQEIGCDVFQGFLFARPMPSNAVPAFCAGIGPGDPPALAR
ncbi:EAL domain-containing protein [Pseudooceanicola sp. CBS1P-1]|nr:MULTISPECIES: EAL domain-containing protein [Pseudooceanicola]MBT9383003.1 EAL domain-containing protein [Pseudooceanicola endophyticus]